MPITAAKRAPRGFGATLKAQAPTDSGDAGSVGTGYQGGEAVV
jgi:hypothetical protein